MTTEPLIHWPDPLREYAGFLASFAASGAVGLRFAVLSRMTSPDDRAAADRMSGRAASFGLVGALATLVLLGLALPGLAERRHMSVAQLISGNGLLAVQIGTLLATLLGFALAAVRVRAGWVLAALGVLGCALRAGFFAQWPRLVNPVHMLAGGLWIGTLLLLAAVGLPVALGPSVAPERRAAMAAEMVRAFSPFALVSAALLGTFGVITAWRHLKFLAALWTTPYGITLVTKLCVVAVVAGWGAFNWRRQRPRMGTDEAARSLGRSAAWELIAANVVLLITAILVSLPTPELPGK